jgi:cell division protein FtsB
MNENNSTRNFIYMLLLMLWLLLLFCVALYKYDQSHNTGLQSYLKVQKQLSATRQENDGLGTKNDVLTATNVQLMQQKSQLCTELSKAKIVDPLCVQ